MKKSIILIVILVIIALGVWMFGNKAPAPSESASNAPTAGTSVSETTKVSDKLSEYKNEELGFSVKYPSIWEIGTFDSGVSFVIPTGKSDTHTIKKLESKITVFAGKCAFPPVTTVKERSTVKVGDLSFNMISIANSVQGTNYFDRMYSLQKDSICYFFTFSSINVNPSTKGIKGSAATQITNNNKALIDGGDQAFTTMVKSFAYVISAQGQDETQVVPTKKK